MPSERLSLWKEIWNERVAEIGGREQGVTALHDQKVAFSDTVIHATNLTSLIAPVPPVNLVLSVEIISRDDGPTPLKFEND